MARRTRIDFHVDGFRELMRTPDLVEGVSKVAEACNEESSWGGYDSAVEVSAIRARGRVWSYGSSGEERANRMVRNLDRGKP